MLEESIVQSAAILNSNFIAIALVKDRLIIWSNAAMHRVFGYEPDELIGQPTRNLFLDQESYEAFGRELYPIIAEGGTYTSIFQLKRKDGSTGWYEYNVSSLAGSTDKVVGTMVDITAYYSAAKQLEASELRYRSVVEDQTEVIARFLPDGKYVFVNDVYCKLFGKPADQLVGLSWHPEAHPDDIPMIEAKLREMTPENPVVTIENRVYIANGEMRWMQFVNRGFFDDDGILLETQSVGRDITKLKQAEAALLKSEELNRQTLQALPAHIAVLDREGRIVITNIAWETFATQNKAVGKQAFTIGGNYLEACRHAVTDGDDDAAKAMAGIDAVMTGHQLQFSMEYTCHGPQEQRWFYMKVVRFGNSQEGGVVITHLNITDLKQAEIRLRESDERLELALAGSGLVLWDWNIPERKVTAGKRWFELLGYTSEELGDDEEDWMGLINPKDLEGFKEKLSSHLQGETANFESEHRLRHKNGHWVPVDAKGKVTRRDKDNTPLRMVGTILDITQRKRLNEEGMDLLKRIELLIRENSSHSSVKADEDKSAETLTKRQRQILGMIATGMTSAEIGKGLYLSTSTVISHRRNLMAKLNLHSTAEVTRYAIEHGLLTYK